MTNHPNRSVDYPEPAIPAGYNASEWLSWTQINTAAYMLGLSKEFDVGENVAVSDHLQKMIAAGSLQKWKRVPYLQLRAYYRMIWK